MSASSALWRTTRPTRAWYRGLRATHPVTVLRWLRNGVLVAVVATAVLYLLVATEARRGIAAAARTTDAVVDIGKASAAAVDAKSALSDAFQHEDVSLIGTGTAYANDMARVNTEVTLAAKGNAAGEDGDTHIRFVQGQLTTCLQLAEAAVNIYDNDNRIGDKADIAAIKALADPDQQDRATGADIPDTGGLIAALHDLMTIEQGALAEQRRSPWLAPARFWLLLLGPVLCMLLLVSATGYVLARHFRRLVSPLLGGALLVTAGVAIAVGVLGTIDGHRLSGDPRAGNPLTMSIALLMLATATVLAHLAYRPRLAEYRFQPS